MEDYKKDIIENDPTKNKLNQISFTVRLKGKEELEKIQTLLDEKVVQLEVPSDQISIRAKVGTTSYSYNGVLDDDTVITYSVTLTEVDPDLPESWSTETGLIVKAISNHAHIKALIELLLEKGIINEKEILDKYLKFIEEDRQKVMNLILYGKTDDYFTE